MTDCDGRVLHSGGSIERSADFAHFSQIGTGLAFDDPAVPDTGRCDWVGATALLVRRETLQACPIDPAMTAYYEDNDWCLRVSERFRDPFRRCREALAIHDVGLRRPVGLELARRDAVAQRLAAHARFLDVHGVLLKTGWDELRDVLGTDDPAASRLLLRLVSAYGPDWLLAEWVAGDLAAVLADVNAARARIAQAEVTEERVEWLETRHDLLERVEAGGWWRLRRRLLPVLRALGRMREMARP